MATRMLVVDDERLIRWSVKERLTQEGFAVTEAEDGASARKKLQQQSFDVALFDLRLPDTDGMTLLHEARQIQPELPVVIITAFSTVEGAVDAMKAGAVDYVTKPFNMDELVMTVRRTVETSVMRRTLSTELRERKSRFGLGNIVGNSPQIREVKDLLRVVAQSPGTTVLLLGESGTGKDMAARAIHYESNRAQNPFMNITCTALPESLLESELFGFEAGSFTSAISRKKGLFELADEGTVFMDEIGDMPPALQAKVLRILDEKAFKRIGGAVDILVDVRIIAATNRNLQTMVEQKTFREDLYYRLSIVPVVMPPLRERRDDVAVLSEYFLELFSREFRKEPRRLTEEAAEKLAAYPWPGNVRELRNVLERAVLLGSGETIGADDIVLGRSTLGQPRSAKNFAIPMPPEGCTLAEAEKSLLLQAMERVHGNQTKAGQILGISRDQVRYKLEKFGINPRSLG